MKRVKLFISMIAFVAVISTGIAVYAANCAPCEASGVHTELISCGERAWSRNYSHKVEYSEGGVHKWATCDVYEYEDRVGWLCPKGHGVVTAEIHHVANHSSSHCEDLDYYE